MRLLLWLAVGLASEPMLAPTLQDLDASMLRVARLMERAAEHEDDLAAAQALWVDDRCSEQQCTAARVADLVRQQREAGSRLRQDVQGARAELVRADRMVVFPPLHPLVDSDRKARLDALRTETDRRSRSYTARAAWARALVEPLAVQQGLAPEICPPEDAP